MLMFKKLTMSASIYLPPQEIEVPKFNWKDISKYKEDVDKFIKDLSKWCKENYETKTNKGYIGETIKFPVGDGYALYMVASLRPLKLVHLPINDAWEFQYVDLMTADRVKKMIDAEKRFISIFHKTPSVKEVGDALKIGLSERVIETTNMSEEEISKFDVTSIGKRYFHIKWDNRTYMIPVYSNDDTYGHKIYKYLVNNYKI